MNNKCLLYRPEVLFEKSQIGAQIGVKSYRENGFQFRKIQVDELPYTHIGDCQTYSDKINIL